MNDVSLLLHLLTFKTLETGIDQLQKASLEFSAERKHYFKDGFKMLSQILELSSYDHLNAKEIVRDISALTYYSQGSTMHLAKYFRSTISKYFTFFSSALLTSFRLSVSSSI